jgi:hypothetical protein
MKTFLLFYLFFFFGWIHHSHEFTQVSRIFLRLLKTPVVKINKEVPSWDVYWPMKLSGLHWGAAMSWRSSARHQPCFVILYQSMRKSIIGWSVVRYLFISFFSLQNDCFFFFFERRKLKFLSTTCFNSWHVDFTLFFFLLGTQHRCELCVI